jgi:hypothetical protein
MSNDCDYGPPHFFLSPWGLAVGFCGRRASGLFESRNVPVGMWAGMCGGRLPGPVESAYRK